LYEFFETPDAASIQSPTGIYSAGIFSGKGIVTSNPRCRVACSLPLANPDHPEISASGELTVNASEVTNEGSESEKYFRVKSKFRIRITP
jgi:hypothetical protein